MVELANLKRTHIRTLIFLMIFSFLMINALRIFYPRRELNTIKRHFDSSVHTTPLSQKNILNRTQYLRRNKKRICQKYGLDKKYNLKFQKSLRESRRLKTVIVDDKHKTLFCYVPKVASGNWKRTFLVLKGEYQKASDIEPTEAHRESLLKTLQDYPNDEIRRKIRDYSSYVVVREPMERLLSAYVNKIYHDYTGKFNKLFGGKILKYSRRSLQTKVRQNISFAEFVEFMTKAPEKDIFELHWERIYKLCQPCLINYNLIGRYENISNDSQKIIDRIAPNSGIIFPTNGKQSDGNNTRSFMASYFSQITEKQLRKLLSLYELDYLLFDYPSPQYLFKVVKKDKLKKLKKSNKISHSVEQKTLKVKEIHGEKQNKLNEKQIMMDKR